MGKSLLIRKKYLTNLRFVVLLKTYGNRKQKLYRNGRIKEQIQML